MGSGARSIRYARGTTRTVHPHVTWIRVEPLLAGQGVTRVADLTGLDCLGIPVMQAVRPTSRTVSVSQGKGLDPMSARVSAVMEAIELSYAESFAPLGVVTATQASIRPPYDLRSLDLAARSLLHRDLPLQWCTGTGLLSGDPRPVPVDLIRLDHTFRARWEPPVFSATSNGLASGNSVVEATVHGLAELCERDSLARQRDKPPDAWNWLDTDTVGDADASLLLELFDTGGTAVEVLIVARRPLCIEARIRSGIHPVTYSGAGCHLDPTIALLRALTEAAQSRLTSIAGVRDDLPPWLYRSTGSRASTTATRSRPVTAWSALPESLSTGDLEEDLHTLALEIHRRTGQEPIRVILHAHDIAVVKVIGPGLRFDPRADISRPAPRGAS